MKKNHYVVMMLLGIMFLFGLVGSVQAATKFQIGWWHQILTQTQRNEIILNFAKLDLNLPSVVDVPNRCNCKEWARRVVQGASKGVIDLPQTSTDLWSWKTAPYIYAYSSNNIDVIEKAKPGQLIQMHVYKSDGSFSTEHTAIVYGQDSSKKGIHLVDANWKTCKITKHYMTYVDFYSNTKRKFTLYDVQ